MTTGLNREMPHIGNSELIAQVNRKLVLQAVRRLQPTFRAEVSRSTNLNPATVTAIVSDLLQEELLKEIPGESKSIGPAGGRPPMMLELNDRARRILAIDLEPEMLRVTLVGLNLQLVEYQEQAIDRRGRPEDVIRAIADLCDRILGSGKQRQVDGIGLSVPGLIDRNRGVLLSSTNMPMWHNVPIRDLLKERLGREPKMERACHLAAMHEDWIDHSGEFGTKLVFSLRTGIGMSLVRHGEFYVGAGGFDGEVGHTVIDLDGPLCECGNKGCLETFVRPDAVRELATAMLREGRCRAVARHLEHGDALRPELIYQLAREGDADCAEIVRHVGRYIGLAAANLVNLLAPDMFILCGSIDRADDLILEAIRQQIDQRALPQFRRHLTVRLAAAQEKSALLGAAVLVARELFELPRLVERSRLAAT